MPVYAYQCNACGTPLEVRQSFSDDALTVCPTCGGALRKRFNAVGVSFKGSGFYRTDSRASSGSGGTKDSAASPSASDTTTTSSGSTTSS